MIAYINNKVDLWVTTSR